MFFTRKTLIKIKNYFILFYVFFLLFHGTSRCVNTKTFSALYDYIYFYVTKENSFDTLSFETKNIFFKMQCIKNKINLPLHTRVNWFYKLLYFKENIKYNIFGGGESKNNVLQTKCNENTNSQKVSIYNFFLIKKVSIMCKICKITIINIYNLLKTVYSYNVIFSYFYTNNLKTDIITIKNDIDICYNNLLIPLFWIMLILIRRVY
jgi:hypothetical protein